MADGDREALAELYDRHATALFNHAVALARSSADAADLVQGVFVRVAGLGVRLLGIRSAGAYMHGMLRTAFLDGERHRGVAAEEPLGRIEPEASAGVAEADRLALGASLGRLPAEQREVIVLHVVHGMTFREIAAMARTSQWTAASRYRLGMDRLRGMLGTHR
jgi:RNA polymerase sigma-70 factor (ECF subfamily)